MSREPCIVQAKWGTWLGWRWEAWPKWDGVSCKEWAGDPIERFITTTNLLLTCSMSEEIGVFWFWVDKCISWTLFRTNIKCLTDTKLVQEYGQIEMENGLILSLSLKADIFFSLHDNSTVAVAFCQRWYLIRWGIGLLWLETFQHSVVGLIQIMIFTSYVFIYIYI